jgi:hypothetical protein
MGNPFPASHQDLVRKKAFAFLATVNPDGTPQVTPVWFDMAGDNIRINTARGRIKDRNMSQNAHVALSILDPDDPYRHVSLRGRIVKVSEAGADADIDELSQKYLGKPYPGRRPGEQRVTYEIEPISYSAKG